MKESLFIGFQYLVPQRFLSRAAGWLANTRIKWIKNSFTRWFVDRYGINMAEAINSDPCAYPTFNDFFTRALKPGVRPVCTTPGAVVSPADGAISQLGDIRHQRILQAKGQDYSLLELVGGDTALAAEFSDGKFAVVYLSPRDYHRVHMPLAGKLRSMTHVPGDLFSVNDTTAANVPRLFARNERAVCIFDTEAGPMAVILVGAMIVASIETVWAGQITPQPRTIKTINYQQPETFEYQAGDEIGRFKLGSTVVMLFGKEAMRWSDNLGAGSAVRMGTEIGQLAADEDS
ncbi:MAG: phosphatidylserine decarboxylase [Gammaproteobacteria bacterium]|uniref:archaetidylserine decarboxylase n=1 Tax=Pseudomaricurvus alcaniphilus TaxID=1166482 RepID=UPI00140BDFB7|nr:archaetidylserine decarboxylase [Pseudomaricurvus alcaniphilus]MBR9909819.1 phosphatidylserine decarboxylase [Gammaproteobacteria bacterium]NHN38545.1 phosphatidylserine decarboxylase [Pseudomaricurvus alcaniphilus]